MKDVLLQLREREYKMSPTEKEISKYIRNHPQKASTSTIRQLAEDSYTSPSSIERFCRMMGFEGYREFRMALFMELSAMPHGDSFHDQEVSAADPIPTIIDKVSNHNIKSLEDTRYLLEPQTVSRCAELLINCKTLLLFGIGGSFIAAKDSYLKFIRLKKSCMISEDWHYQLLQAKNSSPQDLAIILSHSGRTKEMIDCMKILKQNQTPCVAVTSYYSSPVCELADYTLYTAVNEDLYISRESAARFAQLNVMDILYMAYVCARHEYSIRQFTDTYIPKSVQYHEY